MRLSKRLLLCMICLLLFVTGCSAAATVSVNLQDIQLEGETTLTAAFSNPLLQDMKGIAENANLQLYVNEQTAEIAVLDKRNGKIWRSNPADREMDPVASGEKKDLLSAQINLEFSNEFGQLSYTNSYTDSIAYGQVVYSLIPDGVKVTYKFGTVEKNIDDLPKMISKERFEEKILSKIDNSTLLRALRIAYIEDKGKGVYVRNDGLAGLQLKRTFEAFEMAGYTEEDLAYDLAEHNLSQEKPAPRLFFISIEYRLEEDSLVVRVPVNEIRYLNEYPVHTVSILNYFGAAGTDEEGALLVPDGSGALIYFNNGKAKYPPYRQEVYGTDYTVDNTVYLVESEKARMPVFGIIRKDGALFGIIEEGASVAIINADVSGRENSYNYVYPSFYVIHKDDVVLQGEGQKRSFPRYQEIPMKTDFTVRYVFLSGNDASYEGMARYYQKYLAESGMLRKNRRESTDDSIPFYLHLIGSIPTRKHFIGVPYMALEPLTTFEEARIILSELEQAGVSNIRLKYSGWFNGGEYHKVPKTVSVDGVIGGKKGLEELLDYISGKNIGFYPDVALLRVYNTSGFNETKESARRLTALPAVVYPVDLALNRRNRDRMPSYVLSPRYLDGYVDKMLSGMAKLNLDGISLRDLADELNSDFRKRRLIDRSESEKISVQALEKIYQDGLKIMVRGGNAYALPYTADITDLPMGNSKYKIEDESVPFYQMIVRGFVDYTGKPYNLSTYTDYRRYVLKCLEYGSSVHFTWSYEPSQKIKDTDFDYLYSIYYREWMDLAVQAYREVNEVLKRVNGQKIISHQKLGEGVYKTVYENGVYTIVNYNSTPVVVEGIRIEAEDFYAGGDAG